MEHVPKSSRNEIRTLKGVGSKGSPSRDSQVSAEPAANSIMGPSAVPGLFSCGEDGSAVQDRAVDSSNQPAPLVPNKMDQS